MAERRAAFGVAVTEREFAAAMYEGARRYVRVARKYREQGNERAASECIAWAKKDRDMARRARREVTP